MKLRWHFSALRQGWLVRLYTANRMGREYFVPVDQAPTFMLSVASGVAAASPAVAEGIMQQFHSNPQAGSVVLH